MVESPQRRKALPTRSQREPHLASVNGGGMRKFLLPVAVLLVASALLFTLNADFRQAIRTAMGRLGGTAPATQQDSGLGSPPALAAGQAPALPQPGPSAEPRALDQIGVPQTLTISIIPKGSLTPAPVGLRETRLFERRL